MSPASGDLRVPLPARAILSFHSINVPSEWGHSTKKVQRLTGEVSIQLMSPASGDTALDHYEDDKFYGVSIQLMSPASGDNNKHYWITD